jgi:hypothetical protein
LKVLCYDNVLWQHLAEKRWRLSYNTKPDNWRIFYRNLHIKRREEKLKQALALKQMQSGEKQPISNTIQKTALVPSNNNNNNNNNNNTNNNGRSNNINSNNLIPPANGTKMVTPQKSTVNDSSSSDLLEVGSIVGICSCFHFGFFFFIRSLFKYVVNNFLCFLLLFSITLHGD